MRRREFIAMIGGAAAGCDSSARVGLRNPTTGNAACCARTASTQTLADCSDQLPCESGYTNDKVVLEARWANGQMERLPKLAAELVALQVAAIVTSTDAALAAKEATASIPIIFVTGADPVTAGLVSSINQPGGNITGVSFYAVPITGKRLELLHQLVPKTEVIAVLQDPSFVALETETREIEMAARNLGQKINTFKAGSEQEIDRALSAIAKSGAGALLVGAGPFINSRRSQLVGLAALHAIPASYVWSEVVAAGGLMSYGASQTDAYRRAGIYAARILNGEKPRDLPIELPDKYELAINLKTAKALGLTVPPTLIARADEVIE